MLRTILTDSEMDRCFKMDDTKKGENKHLLSCP